MCASFCDTKFINFNKGHVFKDPMTFAHEISKIRRPWTLAQKIEVFECRVQVWQLGVAVEILKEIERHEHPSIWSHSAFGLLAVIFSYFEMIGKTLNKDSKASGTAGKDFNYGFCDVYRERRPADGDCDDKKLPEVKEFRNRIRNGIYHLVFTKSDLIIKKKPGNPDPTKDFVVQSDCDSKLLYYIDIHRVIPTIVNHFSSFLVRLRESESNSGEMAKKFEEFFDTFYKAL